MLEHIARFFCKYVCFVYDVIDAYAKKMEFQPPGVALGIPLVATMLLVWMLPRWLFLLLGGLVAVPCGAIIISAFWMVFIEGYGRRDP